MPLSARLAFVAGESAPYLSDCLNNEMKCPLYVCHYGSGPVISKVKVPALSEAMATS